MAVTPTYPGIYIQEVPSGVRTIAGVGTSIGVFIGRARSGPLFDPVLCLGYADFERTFGGDPAAGQLAHYVRLFFQNGGTQCYVVRIANGALPSSVTLANEAGADVLRLTAKAPGLAGEDIRALVTYSGQHPESTFNVDLFRWNLVGGKRVKADPESWKNLTMDPASPLYAPTFLTQNSKLVNAEEIGAVPAIAAFSQSGRPVQHAASNAAFRTAWNAMLGANAADGTNRFRISVDGSPFVTVDLSAINVQGMPATSLRTSGLPNAIRNAIHDAFQEQGLPGVAVSVSFVDGPDPGAGVTYMLRIASAGTGDVYIRPAGQNDLAIPLMLGTEQGGIEIGAHALRRPAPNGIVFRAAAMVNETSPLTAFNRFGELQQQEITELTLEAYPADGPPVSTPIPLPLQTAASGTERMFVDGAVTSHNGNRDGIREKFAIIAAAINAQAEAEPTFPWRATVAGYRLAIQPVGAAAPDNTVSGIFATTPEDLAPEFLGNVKHYTLGAGGLDLGEQTAGTTGSDGDPPVPSDYDETYRIIRKEVDLFNLLILAPDAAVPVQSLYPLASVFCQEERAFLLMDPPEAWTRPQDAINSTTGVASLRVGLVKDHAALFFPRVVVDDRGRRVPLGPAGAIAGLMARTDATRGVWKAPAGTEADLRGIVGLEQRLSDPENGVLNPRGVNTLRIFPNGIVNWGARTMDGDDDFASEYKYIPIRRLALFIEESLYRGLKWVVFEPNDEPLWAQIRLNVGAFLHGLFRQGAFQGQTPKDAYFVKCDRETTTQTDRNLGVVKVMVGFAPLKPAEFVIIRLQQMAGQIEV
jgi:uncharacterized protein